MTLISVAARIMFPIIGLPLLLFCPEVNPEPTSSTKSSIMVAAYLPEWRHHPTNYADICTTVTHLIFFSIEVRPDGTLSALDRLPSQDILDDARQHCDKIQICVGGNGRSDGFSRVVSTSQSRRQFVSNLLDLCDRMGFDGVDYNWEYPGYRMGQGYLPESEVTKDYEGFHALLQETSLAFSESGKIVTLAYYPDGRQERLLKGAERYVESMHMMSYDQGGRHSTMEFARKVATRGIEIIPPEKLTLGLPFYGRHMKTGDWKTYEDLVKLPEVSSDPTRDETDAGYYYNGPRTIENKVRMAMELGLGGVMIWESGQDCRINAVRGHVVTCPSRNLSLHKAVARGLAGKGQENDSGVHSLGIPNEL